MNNKKKILITISLIVSILLLIIYWEAIFPLLVKIALLFFKIILIGFLLYIVFFAVVPICNELLKQLKD